MNVRQLLLAGMALFAVNAQAGFLGDLAEEDPDQPEWKENAVTLPPFPDNADLIDFYVSPTARNRAFVDLEHLSVGTDGVVRYTLVVQSPTGARNVSYEGMRCKTAERRIYATGRADGQWVKTRAERWFSIREATANRQHAALYRDFFCPGNTLNYHVEDIRNALRQEGKKYED